MVWYRLMYVSVENMKIIIVFIICNKKKEPHELQSTLIKTKGVHLQKKIWKKTKIRNLYIYTQVYIWL